MKLTDLLIFSLLAMCMACSPKTTGSSSSPAVMEAKSEPEAYIPKATAIRIAPEYSDKVAVTLDADGKLTYFPAPSDITLSSSPLELGNGWWLNRQGIGANSVFTRYTFKEYSDLRTVPSPSEIMDAVIPGSKVEEIVTLPFSINDASSHLEEIRKYLK